MIRDAVGNVLADGDTVTVVKALKVKSQPGRDQGRHQGARHPPRGRRGRPRHRLQDRRFRPHATEVQRGQGGLTRHLCTDRRRTRPPSLAASLGSLASRVGASKRGNGPATDRVRADGLTVGRCDRPAMRTEDGSGAVRLLLRGRAVTGSMSFSTRRVLTPSRWAVATTLMRACSALRRLSGGQCGCSRGRLRCGPCQVTFSPALTAISRMSWEAYSMS